MQKCLTILIPVYNEEECLHLLYQRLQKVAQSLPCEVEFLFVNDGSTDNSLRIIASLQKEDSHVSYIDLSRNFGKEKAMCARIDYTRGEALVIIDADLQDPPELILDMYQELENGYDDIYAQGTIRRGESWLKKKSSRLYYSWMHHISNIPIEKIRVIFVCLVKKPFLLYGN